MPSENSKPPENSNYEPDSKVDMAELREATRKVFAYDPSVSRKDSVDSQSAKHRRRDREGNKRAAGS